MKPAWDQLGASFADSETVIIGDVDCTVEKDLCSRFGVRGYPTIKYFTDATAADGDKYEGGRDFDSLKTWADENLGPSCSNENIDLCNDAQKAILAEANALSAEDLAAAVAEKAAAIETAEQTFKDEVDKLQKKYTELSEEKDATIASITPSLRLYRSVKPAAADAKDEL